MDDVVGPPAPVAVQRQNGRSTRGGRSAQRGLWWHDAAALAARIDASRRDPSGAWYRLGDGWLSVASDDAPFRRRFRTLFGECAAGVPDAGVPTVRCRVRSLPSPAVALVDFDDEPLDQVSFARAVFADRAYAATAAAETGWQPFGDAILADSDRRLLVRRRAAWQSFAGSLAVNRLLRLQRDVLFFHAAAAGVGERGVLIVGPKGSGKTTLSLALAARGHAFFGDEIAGVRIATRDVVPVRRAASVRVGPRARAVTQALRARRYATDRFPDGTTRRRVGVGTLFPGAATGAARLEQIVFLRGFAPTVRPQPFAPRARDTRLLTPLASTLWAVAPERRAMHFLSFLAGVRCAFLDVGEPEATARVIEQLVEAG